MATHDPDQLARHIVAQRARLLGHLPPLDPLGQADDLDEEVEGYMGADVDLGLFATTDGSEHMLIAEGIRQLSGLTLYFPSWRRMYALANDGDCVTVADGDPEGELAWAAIYRDGDWSRPTPSRPTARAASSARAEAAELLGRSRPRCPAGTGCGIVTAVTKEMAVLVHFLWFFRTQDLCRAVAQHTLARATA